MSTVMDLHAHDAARCATCQRQARLAHLTQPLPPALLADPAVPDGAVRLFALLLLHGNTPATCHPPLDVLAERMGVVDRTVRRWAAALELAGWVTRVPRFHDDGSPAATGFYLYADNGPDGGTAA